MEVGKYLENLKTDCVILFLSQMMCGQCSPPCRREGGAWLRKEAGICMLQPLAFALFWYRGRPEGEERTLLVHLKNKEVFQLTGIYCLVLYCLVLIAWGGGGAGGRGESEVLFTPELRGTGKHTFRDRQHFLLY